MQSLETVIRAMRLRSALLALAGCALLSVGISDRALAQDAEPSIETRLDSVFSYYLKGGGVWRQENAGYQAGSGSPVAYIKRYQWGPGKAMVLDDTFALMADGTCTQWTHNVFNWDRREQSIRGQVFHFAGPWFSGLITKTGDHETAGEFAGIMPDGSEVRMRDTTDLSNPRVAVVTALVSDGKDWNRGDSVSWTHVTSEVKPCGF